MKGGDIGGTAAAEQNTAQNGGGVNVFMGTFNMTGGTISGNLATGDGGGVYVYGTFNLSGKVDISGNTDSSGSSNVYLSTNNDVITVQGKLENTEPIGVTAGEGDDITSGFKEKMSGADPADFFDADEDNCGVIWNDAGTEVKIVPANTVIFDNNIASDSKTKKQYVLPNTETELRANPFTRKAYHFTAWNTEADGSGTKYDDKGEVTLDEYQNLELFAQWKPSELTVSPIADQTWTGQPITPTVTVKDGDATLKLNTDYTVTYKDNTNVGTATVIVAGKGDYKDATRVTVRFNIVEAASVPATVTANTLTYSGKAQALVTVTGKAVAVRWNTPSARTTRRPRQPIGAKPFPPPPMPEPTMSGTG